MLPTELCLPLLENSEAFLEHCPLLYMFFDTVYSGSEPFFESIMFSMFCLFVFALVFFFLSWGAMDDGRAPS